MVKTSYSLRMGYTVACDTQEGPKPFQIIAGRRVWLSVPPTHLLPDLLCAPSSPAQLRS